KIFDTLPTNGCGTKTLRFVLGTTLSVDFAIRLPKKRAVCPDINLELVIGRIVHPAKIGGIPNKALGLPRLNLFQLFGKATGISCRQKCLVCQNCRSLMMTMASPSIGRETIDNHIWSKFANNIYRICQGLLFVPKLERFFVCFRKPKVVCRREKLFAFINFSRGKKFMRTYQPQINTQISTDQVLPAFATRKRKITCSIFLLLSQPSNQPCVFIVRMCCEIKYRP